MPTELYYHFLVILLYLNRIKFKLTKLQLCIFYTGVSAQTQAKVLFF